MPKQKTTTKAYTKEDLEEALRKIKDGMSIKLASRTYHIPRPTLQHRLHNRTKQSVNCSGPPTVLTPKEEEAIVEWIKENARKGFPRRNTDLLFVVKEFLDKSSRKNPFTDNMPGNSWYKNFRHRHPEVRLRKPESITSASSKVSESDIRGWFEHVGGYFEEHGLQSILEDPTRVFNADETSFLLCPKTGRVLAPKGMKNVYEIEHANAKEAITTLFTFSADGLVLTPLIVYPYLRIPNDIRESVPDNFAIDKAETGWMNQDVFYDFVKNTFHPDLVENNVKFPVIFFVDGHKSHLSYKFSELCTELKIVLVCLPPNATRIMQPADVSCFKPVKTGWSDAVVIWKRSNPQKTLTKVRFAKILKIVIDNSIDETTIKNGFRVSGLCPFDANAVDYTKCLGRNYKYNAENVKSETNNSRNNTHQLSLTNAIDLKRFREIVGEEKWLSLNQFNCNEACSRDFGLLYQIFEELSSPGLPTTLILDEIDEIVDIREQRAQIENSPAEQLIETLPLANVMDANGANFPIGETLIAEGSQNSNDFEIISMDDVIALDPKDVTLQDFLTVPPTPQKGKKKNERQFVMTSEIHKMEERIKIEEKIAKEKASEERKRKLVERKQKLEERKKLQEARKEKEDENKAKKLQLEETKKLDKLKKAAEQEEKKLKRAADFEEKKRKRETKELEKEAKKPKLQAKKEPAKSATPPTKIA